ncbi:hypothetical protein HPB49_003205 [Dermacentor silvarum]|uniref:Uncharacterized protein n=1 Tax=Dermacentor silvarum TaxID=543639 RepID=A0ACB8DTH4_DERSI|nr:hypothetical protein HPB49_003205 [Dermacentor silvarum]
MVVFSPKVTQRSCVPSRSSAGSYPKEADLLPRKSESVSRKLVHSLHSLASAPFLHVAESRAVPVFILSSSLLTAVDFGSDVSLATRLLLWSLRELSVTCIHEYIGTGLLMDTNFGVPCATAKPPCIAVDAKQLAGLSLSRAQLGSYVEREPLRSADKVAALFDYRLPHAQPSDIFDVREQPYSAVDPFSGRVKPHAPVGAATEFSSMPFTRPLGESRSRMVALIEMRLRCRSLWRRRQIAYKVCKMGPRRGHLREFCAHLVGSYPSVCPSVNQLFYNLHCMRSIMGHRRVDLDKSCTASAADDCFIVAELSQWNNFLWVINIEPREGRLALACLRGRVVPVASNV